MESEASSSVRIRAWQLPGRPLVGIILTLFALVTSGCFLDRSVLPPLPDPDISAPSMVCAGEPVIVSWTVPSSGTAGCYRRITAGEHFCPTISNVLQNGSSMGVSAGEYPGSRSVVITEDTTFEINTTQYRESDGAAYEGYDSVTVGVVDGAGTNDAFFDGVCGGRGSFDLSGYSQCLHIDSICLPSDGSASSVGPGASVVVYGMKNNGDGTFTQTAQDVLTPDDPCTDVAGFNDADELRADLRNVIDPGGVGIPVDGRVECTVEWPDIHLDLNLSCPTDLGSCSATGMGGGGEGEPTPTVNSSQVIPSGDSTEEPPPASIPGKCDANGGLQYEGDVCVCSGYIDHVVICNDGTKTDTVTEKTCLPDPQACNEGGGSNDGGPQCEEKSCGNSSCQPECGENPNNCPADCK